LAHHGFIAGLRPRFNLEGANRATDFSSNQLAIEVELSLLSSIFGVKMRRLVLFVVHPDDDSEKG
jgi:hypothetical protein